MREIEFRGKDKTTGEWRYGDLMQVREGIFDIYPRDGCFGYGVIYDTIGQYTGLKDNDGRKIFEGDIVDAGEDGLFEVYWGEAMLQWEVMNVVDNEPLSLCEFGGKVIGNIHDTPELLEEGGKEAPK